MRRNWLAALTCCVALALQTQAGEEKVHAVTKEGLKITGAIGDKDGKIKVHDSNHGISAELAAQVHLVKLQAGVKYRIELTAPTFDSFLAVQDSAGKQVAFSDDISDVNKNSRLEFSPPKDATYRIVTASIKDPGTFTLTVAVADTGEAGAVVGKEVRFEGNVAGGDPTVSLFGKEYPAKLHTVKLTAGKQYVIDLVRQVDGLDPLLVLQDKNGKTLANDDDGGGSLNSRITFLCQKDDSYKVFAAAFGGEGRYVLTIKESVLSKEESIVHEVGGNGLRINGRLSQATKQIVYQVKFEAGKTYVIDMTSADQKALDPYLLLLDPKGALVAEDDDGGEGLNSRITYTPSVSGTFRIGASYYGMFGKGEFNLTVHLQE
jgi:hypothetical protein